MPPLNFSCWALRFGRRAADKTGMENTSRSEKLRLNRERKARILADQAETEKIVAGGVCPNCGRGLRRNLALTGWWQCEQLGGQNFRVDPNQPACGWQGFTR